MPDIKVTLPDGKILQLPGGSAVSDVAHAIGPGLAKAALAGEVDGILVDLSHTIDADVSLRIITERDPEALSLLRHSAAHVLATAVRELRPDAGIGLALQLKMVSTMTSTLKVRLPQMTWKFLKLRWPK